MTDILCFGDSNTWGYDPKTKGRFPEDIRWTGLLRERFGEGFNVIEEGLCGRTTVYEDKTRPGRKGIDAIEDLFSKNKDIDAVILMLGTNDCKTYNHSSAESITMGIDSCLQVILENVPEEKVLLISPIHLGEKVWEQDFDPEFDPHSVIISRSLKAEYEKLAQKRRVHFLAASDYAAPSKEDREHLNEKGHLLLASAVYEKVKKMVS